MLTHSGRRVYILCNLFVAVIIDQYGSSKRQLPVSRQNMEVFQNLWKAHLIHDKTTAEPSKDLFNTLQGRTNHTGSVRASTRWRAWPTAAISVAPC